jgi:hypothetical protein
MALHFTRCCPANDAGLSADHRSPAGASHDDHSTRSLDSIARGTGSCGSMAVLDRSQTECRIEWFIDPPFRFP